MWRKGPSFLGLGLDRQKREAEKKRLETAEGNETLEPIPDPLENQDPYPSGMVALDVIIDKQTGRPFILEVQGEYAGVKGIQDLEGNEFLKHKASFWEKIGTAHGRTPKDLQNEKRAGDFRYGYHNPRYVEEVMENKAEQIRGEIIPKAYLPETVTGFQTPDALEALCRKHPRVIIKPHNQAQGIGVERFDTTTDHGRVAALAYAELLVQKFGNFVAQEFIESGGAAAAPDSLKGHYASMRLVVGFRKDAKGETHLLEKFGYWRVAAFHEHALGTSVGDQKITDRDVAVVNRALGAKSVELTEQEMQLVTPAAYEVIDALTAYAKKSKTYQQEQTWAIRTKVYALENKLRDSYSVFLSTKGEEQESEERYRFLFRLQKELSRISKELWNSKVMRRQYPAIEHISDESGKLRGRIRLRHTYDAPEKWYEFSVEEPGSLRKVIAEFVKNNS